MHWNWSYGWCYGVVCAIEVRILTMNTKFSHWIFYAYFLSIVIVPTWSNNKHSNTLLSIFHAAMILSWKVFSTMVSTSAKLSIPQCFSHWTSCAQTIQNAPSMFQEFFYIIWKHHKQSKTKNKVKNLLKNCSYSIFSVGFGNHIWDFLLNLLVHQYTKLHLFFQKY